MNSIKEIVPGVWTWAEFNAERQLDFNGYCVMHGGESVLIDPPQLESPGLEELQGLVARHRESPLRAILLSNAHHERMAPRLKALFSVPVWVHANDRGLLESAPDAVFQDGATLFCGLRAVLLRDQKSPGETAFLLPDRKILIVGDALIGKVPGRVNLLPADKYKDVEKARAGLRRILDLDFEVLLVGDGNSILKEAKRPVAQFLAG